ncbi:2-oxo-hept-3-ene-1,7-dioate hydratase [Aquimarina sp. EL_43]|uniref:2-oxo-hept-4-ene-1,7-dioate hydratase n=1 Tax=unclassified Aquimarina TaxID=2627091 RepID=UPI0018CB909C|nr:MULTISPECIES: 2-oxo-hepta-3-ene-1,7-dioic acid hydratase [unclassified Aquimarina]MBG6132454.1 2-oxo-hept-3-ene-1,7-dioate hydratase [Aquimarina sp. EL_35]MBG6152585.1 2-oxo-hept-3-ene-1,7-dioate hydratase [Aquimarina sp. EL_32]MBG6170488.1 2-oxo-hept-3-ene-1,7-dioate hydratase [Aquimarina sp. EL_43]
MLTSLQIKEEANRLHDSEKNKKQVVATTNYFPEMDINDAYQIQEEWVNIKKKEGRKVVGYKIGLTSKVMQVAMNINEPDYGTLLDDMVYENGCEIKTSDFLDPRIEVELAFVLKKPLFGDTLTIEDVLDATDYVVPVLELIAARTYRVDPKTNYVRTVKDTISDNAANAGIILGNTRINPRDIDLRWVGALLYKNGTIEESGVAAAVLDHPAKGVIWLAKKYAKHNITLDAGQIILAGSFTRPVIVKAGDTITADYNSLGKITCNFM